MVLKRLFKDNKKPSDFSVMVIEDDPSTSLVITELLSDEGYGVHSANNGSTGLKMLDEITLPNVFIIDLMLPDMTGKQFLEKARMRFGRSAFPPVLLLTAATDGEETANELEAEDYLPKPFNSEDLLRHIRDLVNME